MAQHTAVCIYPSLTDTAYPEEGVSAGSFPDPGGPSVTDETVASACLPVERSKIIAKSLPPNLVATIQSAWASFRHSLKGYLWVISVLRPVGLHRTFGFCLVWL